MKDRAVRIYKTIKRNREILTDKSIALTVMQAAKIEQDNIMLYNELSKEVENERRRQAEETGGGNQPIDPNIEGACLVDVDERS